MGDPGEEVYDEKRRIAVAVEKLALSFSDAERMLH